MPGTQSGQVIELLTDEAPAETIEELVVIVSDFHPVGSGAIGTEIGSVLNARGAA